MKSGKVWGSTATIVANASAEMHRIEFDSGAVCSKHLHQRKHNLFFVESGSLLVRVWQKDYPLVDETILKAGDTTVVAPGLYHQFEGVEAGVAFELYWAELPLVDIVRESCGGVLGQGVPN